jgi:type I restriction enzyme S subunit
MNPAFLLAHFERLAAAPDAIPRLRRSILDLVVRGKLVEQDPSDEPASELLKRIAAERARLVEAGDIKPQRVLSAVSPAEPLFDLPRGWASPRLSEISLKIHYGFTASANQTIADVQMIRITDIQDNKVDWRTVPGCEIGYMQLLSSSLRVKTS